MVKDNTSNQADSETTYLAALGKAMIAWNAAEERMKQFLVVLAGEMQVPPPLSARLIIAELNARAFVPAAQAYANSILSDPDEKDHVGYAALLFSDWLAYRNNYFHNIILAQRDRDNPAEHIGRMSSFSAKSKLKIHDGPVTLNDLSDFTEGARTLREYIDGVQLRLIDRDLPKPLPWPEKPPRPAPPEKNTLEVQGCPPPPQSSQA